MTETTDPNEPPVVDITPDPRLHAHEVGGPYRDCPDCLAKAASERGAG
jgi:hypothetical protein